MRPLADEEALFKTFDLMYGDYVGVRVGQQDSSSSSSSSSSHEVATLRAYRIYGNILSEIHQASANSEAFIFYFYNVCIFLNFRSFLSEIHQASANAEAAHSEKCSVGLILTSSLVLKSFLQC